MFCSLITKKRQIVQPGVYTALRFDEESTDSEDWHPNRSLASRDSALIIPKQKALAVVAGMVHWAESDATQILHRISRDPYDEDIDSTATHDRAMTVGKQFHIFTWLMTIRVGQPLALMVNHNASGPVAIDLAEFKVGFN